MTHEETTINLEQFVEASRLCACNNIRKTSRVVSRLYDEALQPIGVRSTQFVTLVTIQVSGPISLTALAQELLTDRSTLSRNLGILQKLGYVESESSAKKRGRLFVLTDSGREILDKGLPVWKETQARFVEKIGQEKWASTLEMLTQSVEATQSV